MPDIAQTGSNLVAGVTEDRRVKFLRKAVIARDGIERALAARTEEDAEHELAKALGFP